MLLGTATAEQRIKLGRQGEQSVAISTTCQVGLGLPVVSEGGNVRLNRAAPLWSMGSLGFFRVVLRTTRIRDGDQRTT